MGPALAVAVLALPSACQPAPPDHAAATPPAAATHVIECGPPIPGAAPLLGEGRVLLLGELHGTRQIPAFVGDLGCHAATAGLAVRVGLELPRDHGDALARYVASDGTAADRDALLAAEHWQRPDQDGRSSEAMLGLVDRVRVLRAAGLDIDVFAFDVEPTAQGEWNERDAAMAKAILARASRDPQALVLTLSGNLHNRTAPGPPWDPNAVPMGVHVLQARPDALSLDVLYASGTAWNCQETCGIAKTKGSPKGAVRHIELLTTPNEYGNHGYFAVGAIEASPPAVTLAK